MTELQHQYPSVKVNGIISYGGGQQWSPRKILRECGCGVIAAVDLILYLTRAQKISGAELFDKFSNSYPISQDDYNSLNAALFPRYLPLIPRLGLNGVSLALGINCFFLRKGISLRCRWGVRGSELFSLIEQMIAADIPVIMSIGPNLPRFWHKNQADFYSKSSDDIYRKAVSVRAHYVVVTGIDEQWLQVSSWGRKYYISRDEYRHYVKKHSNYLVSNIIYFR